jgi:hypothetical protein
MTEREGLSREEARRECPLVHALIEYDRRQGRMLLCREYPDDKLFEACRDRLRLEVERHREGVDTEIVILSSAGGIEAMRKTHSRYFRGGMPSC